MPPRLDKPLPLRPDRAVPPQKKSADSDRVADSVAQTLLNTGRAQVIKETAAQKIARGREIAARNREKNAGKDQVAIKARAKEVAPLIKAKPSPAMLEVTRRIKERKNKDRVVDISDVSMISAERIAENLRDYKESLEEPVVSVDRPIMTIGMESVRGEEDLGIEKAEKEARVAWLAVHNKLKDVEAISADGIELEFFGTIPARYNGTEDGLLPKNSAEFMQAVRETEDKTDIQTAQEFFKLLYVYLTKLDRVAEYKGGVEKSAVADRFESFEESVEVETEREKKMRKAWEAAAGGAMEVIDIARAAGVKIAPIGKIPEKFDGTDRGLHIAGISLLVERLEAEGKEREIGEVVEYAQALVAYIDLLNNGVPVEKPHTDLVLPHEEEIDEPLITRKPISLEKAPIKVEAPRHETAEELFERAIALKHEVARVKFAFRDNDPEVSVKFLGSLKNTFDYQAPTAGLELDNKQDVLKYLRRNNRGYELEIVQKYLVLVARLDIAAAREAENKVPEAPKLTLRKKTDTPVKPMKVVPKARGVRITREEMPARPAVRERLMDLEELLVKSEVSPRTKKLIADARIPFFIDYTESHGDMPKAINSTIKFLEKKIEQVKQEQGWKGLFYRAVGANNRLSGYVNALREFKDWRDAI